MASILASSWILSGEEVGTNGNTRLAGVVRHGDAHQGKPSLRLAQITTSSASRFSAPGDRR
jgi:hypothetical protein